MDRLLSDLNLDPEEFILNLSDMLKTPGGRDIFWAMLAYTGVFRGGFHEGDKAQFIAGQKDVGTFLIEMLDYLNNDPLALMREDARRRSAYRDKEKEEGYVGDVYEPPDDDAHGGGE